MRHWQAAVLLGLVASAGCWTLRPGAPKSAGPRAPLDVPGEAVLVDVALVETAYGDRFLNEGLWELADEQGIELERKPILESNGFRICRLGGTPPDGLQRLLSSPRSCLDLRRTRVPLGEPVVLPLQVSYLRCAFHLVGPDGRPEEVTFSDAQPLLEVHATPAGEDQVGLRCTPRLRHGQVRRTPRATPDSSGALRWDLEDQRPEEHYPGLSWELTVTSGQYLVVGTWLDRADTLGQRCFLPHGDGPRRQRLLVLRCSPGGAAAPAPESLRRAPPLAAQASWTAARGSSR